MIINPNKIYEQKISDINNRINSRLKSFNNCDFSIMLENKMNQLHVSNKIQNSNKHSVIEVNNQLVNSNKIKASYQYDTIDAKVKSITNLDKIYIDEIIKKKAKQYGLSEDLVRAVVKAESSFNPLAVSSAGAIGLMQLMPSTARSLNITNPYDPVQNIDGGVRYLKNQIDNFNGNVKMALAAYNCGPGRLNSLNITNIEDPNQFARLPKETQNYINKIMRYIKENI